MRKYNEILCWYFITKKICVDFSITRSYLSFLYWLHFACWLHTGYTLYTGLLSNNFWYYYDLYSKFCYIFLETHHFFIKKEIYLVASNSLQHALIFESIIHNSLTLLLSLQLTNYLKPFLPKKPCLILISTSYTKIAFLWQWNLCFSISAAPML